jgi:ribose transport system substrate-binding protein
MGFNQVLREHPHVEVIARETAHFDREKARQAMLRLLQKDTEFDAVFAHNDNMILGVLEAMEDSKYEKPVVLIGFDAIKEAVSAVKQGRLRATIAQRPETMGRLAIQSAAELLRGESLAPTILVELELIER